MGIQITWTTSAALMRTRLPQLASLVPVLGYAVIWGDHFQQYIMRFDSLGGPRLLTSLQRIHLLYWGGLIVLIGTLLFWSRCPLQIKSAATRNAYISMIAVGGEVEELMKAHDAVNGRAYDAKLSAGFSEEQVQTSLTTVFDARATLIGEYLSSALPVITTFYQLQDNSRVLESRMTFFLLTVGAGIFSLPSVEVLLRAIWLLWAELIV